MMLNWLNQLLDKASNYLARRKGLIPLIGVLLVALDFCVQFMPLGWFSSSGLLEHLGVILIAVGFMLAWAL